MSVLSLPEAKEHLNISGSANDGEIQSMIDAAEAAIVRRVGPLVSTVTTVRVEGGSYGLLLPTVPVLSLTSVTPVGGGTALTVGDLYIDASSGVVTYNSGASFSSAMYDVVYNAGWTTTPADLKMAVKELLRHMWQTQRGPTRRPGSTPSESMANTVPGAAHTLPFRVTELLAPYMHPGFA